MWHGDKQTETVNMLVLKFNAVLKAAFMRKA
ncbi:hypothetical protein BH11BAC5_BH11BAC5_20370 [soil metagenome]|jgi:hypothetical protein